MIYLIGIIFLLVGLWTLVMTWRAFTYVKKDGDENTSPFIVLGLGNGLIFSVISIGVALACFFNKF
ncbi:hypothetical protein ACWN8V_00265 [Vagococcus elongatus]|uniref:Immunity protein n=1 Tax=Vagococcus elongatus TaxID=180344 RepID=A0A430B5E3_9ENTE|nr:hypothetical protein [Vagococcus elongatus]RSU15545.1 hypothetical protein CBF29_00260 [Vagococcus elongatus]